VLRPAVATHPTTARVVAAAVSFGMVAGFAGLLATVGTAPEWIWLLTGAALAVAPATGAWTCSRSRLPPRPHKRTGRILRPADLPTTGFRFS
jgi:hypothetical protein